MIDTSALMAMVQHEPLAPFCKFAVENEPYILMSAGTFVEAMIVSRNRGLADIMTTLIRGTVSEIIPVTPERALLAAEANALWGKGIHRAGLNFGDCFAYAAAKEFGCPLLYVGNDFSRTDIVPAIAPV